MSKPLYHNVFIGSEILVAPLIIENHRSWV